MRVLLDTHWLIWAGDAPHLLPRKVRRLLEDGTQSPHFSVISLWEIGVKRALKRSDFDYDPRTMRRELLASGFVELPLTAEHVLAVERLPSLHRDPFDRLLICQALTEDMVLLTDDKLIAQYPISTLLP